MTEASSLLTFSVAAGMIFHPSGRGIDMVLRSPCLSYEGGSSREKKAFVVARKKISRKEIKKPDEFITTMAKLVA
ncbi:MAG: hypothetical protein D6812_01230, partial [Deltaproteobacteria bacterium]